MTAEALNAFRNRLLAPFETALAERCSQAANRSTEASYRQLAGAIRASPLTAALPEIQHAAAQVEQVPLREIDEKSARLLSLLRQALGIEAAPPPTVSRTVAPTRVPTGADQGTAAPRASPSVAAPLPPAPAPRPPRTAPPPPGPGRYRPAVDSPSAPARPPTPEALSAAPPPPAPGRADDEPLTSADAAPQGEAKAIPSAERHTGLLRRFRHAAESQQEPIPVAVVVGESNQVEQLRRKFPLTAAIGEWTDTHYVALFPRRPVAEMLALLESSVQGTTMRISVGLVPAGYDLSPLVERLIDSLPEPGKVEVAVEELVSEDGAMYYVIVAAEDDAIAGQLSDRLGRLGFIVHRSPDAVDLLQVAHRIVPDLIVLELQKSHVDGANVVTRIRQIRGFHNVPILINGGLAPDEYEEAGLIDVLVKPMAPRDLALRARRLVENAET